MIATVLASPSTHPRFSPACGNAGKRPTWASRSSLVCTTNNAVGLQSFIRAPPTGTTVYGLICCHIRWKNLKWKDLTSVEGTDPNCQNAFVCWFIIKTGQRCNCRHTFGQKWRERGKMNFQRSARWSLCPSLTLFSLIKDDWVCSSSR